MTTAPTIEVVLSPFDTSWEAISEAASTLDRAGIAGLWVMDHFSGAVHGRSSVLECWSTLAGLAHVTENCRLGSLVTNTAVRSPIIVAQTAATIQEQASGRLIVGVGAGGGAAGSPYANEVEWVGAVNQSATKRRTNLEQSIDAIQQTWTGSIHPDARNFLIPKPVPPVIVGGYGPKVATLAGRLADGFNTAADNPRLNLAIAAAHSAHSERTNNSAPHSRFEISVFAPSTENTLDPSTGELERLADAGVDTVQIIVAAPFERRLLESVLTCAGLG